MLRLLQILVGLIALGFDLVAIVYFGNWLSKTDWLLGHSYGPASSLITALWTATAGLIGSGIWTAMALYERLRFSTESRTKVSRRLVTIQGVLVALLLAPVGVIAVVGFAELPRARTEGHVQRIKGGEASVAELIEALESENPSQRFWAVQELQKMGPQAKGAVPALAEVLEDPTEVSGPGTFVTAAAKTLAAIGPEAEPAIPALVEAIKREQGKRSETGSDTPSVLSSLAGKALTKIGPASIPELTTLLAHEDRYVRMTAVDALGNMGSQAKDTIPAINQALNDQDESVRQSAGVALERIAGHRPVSD